MLPLDVAIDWMGTEDTVFPLRDLPVPKKDEADVSPLAFFEEDEERRTTGVNGLAATSDPPCGFCSDTAEEEEVDDDVAVVVLAVDAVPLEDAATVVDFVLVVFVSPGSSRAGANSRDMSVSIIEMALCLDSGRTSSTLRK